MSHYAIWSSGGYKTSTDEKSAGACRVRKLTPISIAIIAFTIILLFSGEARALNLVCWYEYPDGTSVPLNINPGEPEPNTLPTVTAVLGVERCFDLDSLRLDVGISQPADIKFTSGSGDTDKNISEEVVENIINCNKSGEVTSRPTVIVTGNKIQPESDFIFGQGRLAIGVIRLYDKSLAKPGIFGSRWSSNLDYSLTFWYGQGPGRVKCTANLGASTPCVPGGLELTAIYAYRAGGYAAQFSKDSSGAWKDHRGNTMVQSGLNWKLVGVDGSEDIYDGQGRPLTIKDERGVGSTYVYTNNQLTQIVNTAGRDLKIAWSSGKVSSITDPAGKVYAYGYSGSGYLASVTYPDSLGVRGYLYEDVAQPGGLTGITINNVRYSKYSYYADGRVKSSGIGTNGDIDKSSFVYGADYVNVTNALGQTTRYEIGQIDGKKYIIGVERPSSLPTCPAGGRYTSYLPTGNIDYQYDSLGVKTKYEYDVLDRLVQRTAGIGPNGETDQQQITQYVWDPARRDRLLGIKTFGASTSQAIAETNYAYYPDSDPRKLLLSTVTVKNLSAYGVLNSTQVTEYNYTIRPNGLIQTMVVNGPVTGTADQITYQYDTAGNLLSASNSLAHNSIYGNFNALGLPGRITGPNGDNVDYTYDARGRITRERTYLDGGSQDYLFAYDAAGNLTQQTHPDGQTISYSYFGRQSQWLATVETQDTAIFQGQARQLVVFGRNWLGQVTGITQYRGDLLPAQPDMGQCNPMCPPILPDDPLPMTWQYMQTYQELRDYDTGGFLKAVRGSNGQNVQYTYNANGDIATIKDALNRITTLTYDRLRNVVQTQDPLGNNTQYEYDRIGRLTKVIDPRGKATSYVLDGFGQLWAQSNPDTGTASFEYNAGGQRTKMTRANGVITNYLYDGLGRTVSISAGGEAQTFTYDNCLNGKTRLCKIVDPTGELTYAYSPQGQVLTQGQKIGVSPVNFNQSYVYDNMGRLTGIGYPGGVSVGYGYNSGRVKAMTVKIGSATHNVATRMLYQPFGPASSWDYGNGLTRNMNYDMDGRVVGIYTQNGGTFVQGLGLEYSNTNEISKITNYVNSSLTQTYGYDGLSRLTSVTASGANQGFGWDANGNRISHTWGGQTDLYGTTSTNNRLSAITGPRATTYTYDASGNTLSGEGTTYAYNPFNRLNQAVKGGVTTNYWINALGQRVRKDQGTTSTTTGYLYGPSGQVEVEYSWGANSWTHYVRLPSGQPLAMVRGGQISYIHTDHLGRPEVVTNTAKAVVWRASNYAFDRTVTLDSVGGLNLGFPGQYFDGETGNWYNHHRTYNPRTGRYLESDPIGLQGGLNTYAYVFGNPVSLVDPLGLESPGSFNNGGHRLSWENGRNVRAPDYIRVNVSLYVFQASRTLSRSGNMYAAGGISGSHYSSKIFNPQASISIGWLNQCEPPAGSKVDDHLTGYSMAGGAAYRVVGGGLSWSPNTGTSTEVGFGLGGGLSAGELGVQDGSFGDGWRW